VGRDVVGRAPCAQVAYRPEPPGLGTGARDARRVQRWCSVNASESSSDAQLARDRLHAEQSDLERCKWSARVWADQLEDDALRASPHRSRDGTPPT